MRGAHRNNQVAATSACTYESPEGGAKPSYAQACLPRTANGYYCSCVHFLSEHTSMLDLVCLVFRLLYSKGFEDVKKTFFTSLCYLNIPPMCANQVGKTSALYAQNFLRHVVANRRGLWAKWAPISNMLEERYADPFSAKPLGRVSSRR